MRTKKHLQKFLQMKLLDESEEGDTRLVKIFTNLLDESEEGDKTVMKIFTTVTNQHLAEWRKALKPEQPPEQQE